MVSDSAPLPESTGKASVQPAGVLLNKYALLTALVLLLLAAWAGQTVVVIILGLGLSAAGLSLLWSRLALKNLSCERRLSEDRAFPGEYLELKLRLANRKVLPLPWIQISDEVPEGFVTDASAAEGSRPGFSLISRNSSVMWYSAVSWRYRLQCRRRGYYPLGPLTITSGDIFGFYPRTGTYPGKDYITVYPRLFSFTLPVIPSLYPLGETRTDQRLFEDPSRTIGIRDYSPGDSLRRIHWKASVRRGELQVKVFEPSTTLQAGIFLAIDSYQDNGVWKLDEMETGISTAASLSSLLLDKKSQVGLFANSRLADCGRPARIRLSTGIDQLLRILDSLAKVVPVVSQPFAEFFQEERRSLALGTTLIFIFSAVPESMQGVFRELKERGYEITVFLTGEGGGDGPFPDINMFRVSCPPEKKDPEIRAI
ncbi:MAG: DUF58 domain-containing protein [Dehalococcoidales bacterium]|nr:DUF58 domain-containing protein [Dehalococcoidales bacterium]